LGGGALASGGWSIRKGRALGGVEHWEGGALGRVEHWEGGALESEGGALE